MCTQFFRRNKTMFFYPKNFLLTQTKFSDFYLVKEFFNIGTSCCLQEIDLYSFNQSSAFK